MEQPRDSDLRAALDLLLELGDAPDPDAFAERAVAGLGRLIPSDLTAYNGLDPARRRTYALLDPPGELSPEMADALSRHMEDNPLVVHHAGTHDGRARRISDFIGRRELHRRALYNEMFRHLGIEYQMVATLPTSPPLLLGLVFNRTRRDYTERERALLDLLRPHLVRAYENAHARAALGAFEEALDADGRALLVLGRGGTVEHATRRAWDLLGAYFAGHHQGRYLPEELGDWLEGGAAQPFTLETNGRRVRIRLLPTDPASLLLEEDLLRIDEASLASLGPSRREREVLALVAEGRTNAEIAALLWVSPRTVKKHLEGVYEKLGVHTRTAAAAIAHRAARAA